MVNHSLEQNAEKIAVAISGGVDSLVAAYRLKEEGHAVVGIHFVTGYESFGDTGGTADDNTIRITATEDRLAAIARQLDIPLTVVDVSREFEDRIIRYFADTYRAGKTPNPCLVCNPYIKFDLILSKAFASGARRLATGHYARIRRDRDGSCHLLRGMDRKKDQSYFLARLSQRQLSRAVFPLGEITKEQAKGFAAEHGLVPVTHSESQDVCFIAGGDYKTFLASRDNFVPQPGPIVDTSGNVLGTHQGLHRFTVGQRRGIDCPAAEPYYVLRLDVERNRLIVGFKKETFRNECRVENLHWIVPPQGRQFRAHTRVRYRHTAAPSEVTVIEHDTAVVRFDTPQEAVTPGQGAVFYDGDEVLGSGFIRQD